MMGFGRLSDDRLAGCRTGEAGGTCSLGLATAWALAVTSGQPRGSFTEANA
jgi:hypothetical protein